MARYSVLRLLIFFGFLSALWLVGLREESQRWWLLGLSALGSMVLSYFVLQGPRAQFSAKIARHVDERARRAELASADEIAEDGEDTKDIRDTRDTGDTGDTRDTRDTRDTKDTRDTRRD